MDLKIKDVAELLNVSETTIRRWLSEGKIPAYRLNHQFRFSRIEIENWVISCRAGKAIEDQAPFCHEKEMVSLGDEKTEQIVSKKVGTQAFSLFRAIYKGSVLTEVEGDTKEEVIAKSVRIIAGDLKLDSEVLIDLLMDRERLMPTALNNGIAVPHTREYVLSKGFDVVSVVYPERPIEYGALDGEKVYALFFLFACQDKRHLHLLAKLAHFTRSEENREFLMQKPKKRELLEYIKNWESSVVAPV